MAEPTKHFVVWSSADRQVLHPCCSSTFKALRYGGWKQRPAHGAAHQE
ncbi:MAG: hypothetical protein ACLFU8_02555 [Anaerolineales bacterium]